MNRHRIIITLCVLLVVVGASAGVVMAANGTQTTPHPQTTSAPDYGRTQDCLKKCAIGPKDGATDWRCFMSRINS